MQALVQDIDNSAGVNSLPQHGECLERREEATDLSSRTIGVVIASHPTGDASSSRNHKRLSKNSWHHGVAAGRMVPTSAAKTGAAGEIKHETPIHLLIEIEVEVIVCCVARLTDCSR